MYIKRDLWVSRFFALVYIILNHRKWYKKKRDQSSSHIIKNICDDKRKNINKYILKYINNLSCVLYIKILSYINISHILNCILFYITTYIMHLFINVYHLWNTYNMWKLKQKFCTKKIIVCNNFEKYIRVYTLTI